MTLIVLMRVQTSLVRHAEYARAHVADGGLVKAEHGKVVDIDAHGRLCEVGCGRMVREERDRRRRSLSESSKKLLAPGQCV